jgi:Fe-S-cluster-containing dehydrogenase component
VGQETSFWEDIVPRVDPERCRRCRDCAPVAVCLARAFHRNGEDGVPVVDEDFCFGCYSCAGACLHKAIILPTKP